MNKLKTYKQIQIIFLSNSCKARKFVRQTLNENFGNFHRDSHFFGLDTIIIKKLPQGYV